MDSALPQRDAGPAAPARRWPLLTALGATAFAFLLWWLVLSIGHGLGTCGEDSEITAEECVRLCGPSGGGGGGVVWQRLAALGVAAAVVTLAAAVAIWLRRARWPVTSAALLLLLALGVVGLYADA